MQENAQLGYTGESKFRLLMVNIPENSLQADQTALRERQSKSY